MKTFVFTYDRYDTITTSAYLQNVTHTVLCHTEEAKQKFLKAGNIFGDIVATGQPKGLSNNRNYALDQMEVGEWAAFWVDDLIECTLYGHYKQGAIGDIILTSENQPLVRMAFKQECPAELFNLIAKETIAHAEEKGFALCGFSLTGNPMFRTKKFQYWGLADGRCWLVKKTHLRFDTNVQLIDDTCFTAINLKTFGGVVINNWVLPDCKRYTPGAFGTKEDRMEQKMAECAYLVKTYPEYIAIAEKSGWPTGSHVRIRNKRANISRGVSGLFSDL